jgi:uncharacterized protein (TIGR02246 family)
MEQRAQIAAEVDSVTNEWWTVWSTAQDFDRFMSFFVDDTEPIWISDGQHLMSRSEIDAAFRPVMGNLARQDNTPIEFRTIVISPEVVYTIRINQVEQIDTTRTRLPEVRWAETIVWVNREGVWKVLLGHGSSPNESM